MLVLFWLFPHQSESKIIVIVISSTCLVTLENSRALKNWLKKKHFFSG